MYELTMALASHRQAVGWLVFIAFIESSMFPIPPDVILVPMVLAERSRTWTYATVCTTASVMGGLAGYAIGYFLFETLGEGIIAFYDLQNDFFGVRNTFNQYGMIIVFLAAFTPIPYKLITITAGAMQLDIIVFMVTSLIGRGLRFFLVVGLLWLFGPLIRIFVERRLGLVTLGIVVVVVGGILLLKIF